MRALIATARERQQSLRTLWFESQALAEAGVNLADAAMDKLQV